MPAAATFVGIAVAKAYLDLAVRPAGRHERVPHDEAGSAQLAARLEALRPASVVLAAPGGLEGPLAAALAAAGRPVAVVNPRRVRHVAKAVGQVAKRAALDAHLLARFAEVVRPAPRPLPAAEAQALSALLARRQQGGPMLVAERQRLAATLPALRPRGAAHLAWLRRERDALDRALRRQIRAGPAWREADDLLQRAPGIGPVPATTLIAEVPERGRLTASRSPPWSAWRRSTARAASCAAGASSGAAARGCGPRAGWAPWSPCSAARSSARTTTACWPPASPSRGR
jgi:transposase